MQPADATRTNPVPADPESRRSARIGAVLFRYRSWLPLPFVAGLLMSPTDLDTWSVLAGCVVAVLGSTVRAASVAAAGTSTRRRSRNVERLVTHGVYAWVRNPIYIGNLLLWVAVLAMVDAPAMAPIALAWFGFSYHFMIAYEEAVLEATFGAEYLAYKARVARWIPRRPEVAPQGGLRWGPAWRKEWHSAAAVAAITLAVMVKEMLQ